MRILLNLIRHYWGTTTHKAWVFWYCLKFSAKLMRRAVRHDLSKYGDVETESFVRIIHKLKDATYGSESYKKMLAEDDTVRQGTAHHYAFNRHHPEYFLKGTERYSNLHRMNLLDIVEMFCDWRSAVKRHRNGDIKRSIEVNRDRYDMSSETVMIFNNSTDL